MEIPLFVLVLQIGFNAALNNRGYTSNPAISSPVLINSGQTRRRPETDSYLQLSSRGIPESDEQSDSSYSNSFEDYIYRSVRPQQSRPNQRKSGDLNHDSPHGRINSNNQMESLQQSYSSSRRTDPYLRRLNLRNGASNLRPDHTRQNYRKANDDSSLEVSSLESNNPEDASRVGEESTYLRPLLSLIEHPNNRRGQSRQYYRQRPLNELNADEDKVLNYLNNRRNKNPDSYVDSILLVADDDNPDKISIGNPKLQSPEPTSLPYNKLYNRRYDGELNLDEDMTNYLLPIRGRDKKLENYDSTTRRFNRKSNKNAGLESSLNDKTDKLTILRLASLEDLNLESPLLSSGKNRKNNNRNFLRLSLSPDKKLTLDEGVAAELSEILSETLDGLHLAPVSIRRTDLPNNKYSRRRNNIEGNNLRLGSLHIPKPASPLRRYGKLTNRSAKRNVRVHGNHTRKVLKTLSPLRRYRDPENHNSNGSLKTYGNHTRQVLKKLIDEVTAKIQVPGLITHGNHTAEVLKKLYDGKSTKTLVSSLKAHDNHTRQMHKKIFDKDTAKDLVTYHEGKSNKVPNNRKHENQNNSRGDDGWSDEFSLDTLFAFRKEGNLSFDLPINKDNLNLKPSFLNTSDEILPKSDDVLHLEYPWNDPLSPDGDKNKSQLRTNENNDTTDTLQLELPWNAALTPDGDKDKSKMKTNELKDEIKDTNDTLKLEFPWNDGLSSDSNKEKSKLRTVENTSTNEDTLHLDDDNDDKSKSQLMSGDENNNTNDAAGTLHLESPWNDALSSTSDKDKTQSRSDGKNNNTNDTSDTLHLEFPWNDAPNPDSDKGKKQLTNKDDMKDTLHLEYPWNDQLRPDENKTVALLRNQTENHQDKEPKDDLKLSWNDQTSTNKPSSEKTLRIPDPFYVHPYLRSRNLNKHPSYYERSYDEYSERRKLENLKSRRTDSRRRKPKRRPHNDLEVLGLSRSSSEEDQSDLIKSPSGRRPHRLRTKENNPPLVTTTCKPKDAKSFLKNRKKSDRETYNATIIFPKD